MYSSTNGIMYPSNVRSIWFGITWTCRTRRTPVTLFGERRRNPIKSWKRAKFERSHMAWTSLPLFCGCGWHVIGVTASRALHTCGHDVHEYAANFRALLVCVASVGRILELGATEAAQDREMHWIPLARRVVHAARSTTARPLKKWPTAPLRPPLRVFDRPVHLDDRRRSEAVAALQPHLPALANAVHCLLRSPFVIDGSYPTTGFRVFCVHEFVSLPVSGGQRAMSFDTSYDAHACAPCVLWTLRGCHVHIISSWALSWT